MQKRILAFALVLIFLCGCGGKGTEPSDKGDAISLQAPDTTEEKKEIPPVTITEYPLPEEVAALEELDIVNMGFYIDREQSMQNSNHLNFGTLASDEDGNIYFTDFTQNAIFMSGAEGENKELLYEGSGEYLCVSNGYLYFGGIDPKDKYIDSFVRIAIGTKEVELLYGEPCGEVMVLQDNIYFNSSGLTGMDCNAPDGKFIRLSEMKPVFFNTDGRYLFYNMITDAPDFLFQRGYLLAWDTETETNYFVGSKMVFPLLAGNWLSYVDTWTGSRHVLDLETGTDTDLEYYAQRAVSDGSKLYWCIQQETGSFQIMQWDGEGIQELCVIEVESERYGDPRLFLTEGYLYWIYETKTREDADWGYYRFADGKTGRLN